MIREKTLSHNARKQKQFQTKQSQPAEYGIAESRQKIYQTGTITQGTIENEIKQ